MEGIRCENLSFTYPNSGGKALHNINFTINQGEFVLVCGKSGCGKTTLLRLFKNAVAPFGEIEGEIYFGGKILSSYSKREQAESIGFVMQNLDNQIVTDKVWHELAFGLESLGYSTPEIRMRVSEMASFFGIQKWFYKNVAELSGGQKQLLNLASVMVMQPSVLILDEPTSQLDPIAAQEFLRTLEKINRELGVTVILTEHRLEDAFPIADRVVVMDDGSIIADAAPDIVSKILKELNHDMYTALPTAVKVHGAVENSLPCPLTVRDGRCWLEEFSKENLINPDLIPKDRLEDGAAESIIEIKDAWFRYEKELSDVVKGLSLKVKKGEMFCLVGENGTGKTTALSLIAGLNKPYRGNVFIKGKNISEIQGLYNRLLGVLPQNPQSVFVKKTVSLDLEEILSGTKLSRVEKEKRVQQVLSLCRIEKLSDRHPYDLSGGEQQRAALAKVLLTEPEILLLDEPTKGMDAYFKEEFAEIIEDLKKNGVTIVMVTHDIEFAAKYADRCALMFDGNITSEGAPRGFFKGKSFYTTSANRMARTILPDAVLAEDIIMALGGVVKKRERKNFDIREFEPEKKTETPKKKGKLNPIRIIFGVLFAMLFIVTLVSVKTDINILNINPVKPQEISMYRIIMIVELFMSLLFLLPKKDIGIEVIRMTESNGRLSKRTLAATFLILLLIPVTIYFGFHFLGDRKYYFISLLIIIETMIPFFMVFEAGKPRAREIVVISVLCAIAVAGRYVFFMLPQFKPVAAIVIIAGICFGGETGFLVGAVSGFVSNFMFGQGPWTPWQMFAFGIIGFVAGILFKKGFLRKTKSSLACFGFFSALIIYGGIVNPASVIMWQKKITWGMLLSAYAMGIWFDLVHALSTGFFLWFISEPMIEKLERIKIKYGLVEK